MKMIKAEDAIEVVRKTNESCFSLGLKTIDPKTGQQLMPFWLPEEIKQLLILEHRRPEKLKTGLALVKYFFQNTTWWFSEYDPEEETFYGRAENYEKEYGYTSLEELRSVNTKTYAFNINIVLYVERDYHFTPQKLSEV